MHMLALHSSALHTSSGLPSAPCANFKCKNGTSDWPPCRPPSSGYRLRFGAGSSPPRLPITAWWGPVGYAGNDSHRELVAYAGAGFNIVQVSDRGPERCTDDPEADAAASWSFVHGGIEAGRRLGLQSLVDTYRCRLWGGSGNGGGDAQASDRAEIGVAVSRTAYFKITLPEVKWLAPRLVELPSVVGLLITDDGVDLAANEVQEVEWMREHTPTLLPWVNQCGDGSEWLARAGTPYALPELYSIRGPGGDAYRMAAAQLSAYDAWAVRTLRFGLGHWPLLNVGDGIDTGLLRSESLLRFQAYAALAYGAVGINWFTWANGIWNKTTQSPTPIYAAVAAFNHRASSREWSSALLRASWQGVFHAGGEPRPPAASASPPSPNGIVTGMHEQLLAGVLLEPEGSVLLLVTDTRLSADLHGPPPRVARVRLNPGLVDTATALRGGECVVHAAPDGIEAAVTLSGGEALLLRLRRSGTALAEAAAGLRRDRHGGSAARPHLGAARTTQYQFYGDRPWPQTLFPIGALVGADEASGGAEGLIAQLAAAHLNLAVVPPQLLWPALNHALRAGVFVMPVAAEVTPQIDSAGVSALLQRVLCHPNLAGVLLSSRPLDTGNRTALALVTKAGATLRHDASTMLGMALAPNAQAVDDVATATSLPLVALSHRRTSGSLSDIMARMQADAAEYAALRARQLLRPESKPLAFAVVVACHGDATSAAATRFAAFSAVAFGATAVFFEGLSAAGAAGWPAASEVALKLAQWGDKLCSDDVRLLGLLNSGFHIAGTGGNFNGSALVTHMDNDLLLAFFEQSQGDLPPLVLVVDMRSTGGLRNATVAFNSSVVPGWSPVVGDAAAGFESCKKLVRGSNAAVRLAEGDAVLIALSVYSRDADDESVPRTAVTETTMEDRARRAQIDIEGLYSGASAHAI